MSAFDRSPFIVIWETTRACALACIHCRAEAMPRRDPNELTTEEGRRLLDRVAAFGSPSPIVVLTGGDPLRRPDIVSLVAYGTRLGLSVSLTPSGAAAVTRDKLGALQEAGLARLAVSLDGATAKTHDAFRGVKGSHRYTMRIIEHARALDLPLQINTTVSSLTRADLPELARQMIEIKPTLWALFFLIPVGRAQAEQALSAEDIDSVLHWAADLAARLPFGVKTTEAPHYHRILAERGRTARTTSAPDLIGRAGRAVTDGNGFVFIDHVGNICPSGFLPLVGGNVRRDDLVAVYREEPLFLSLRDPARLGGRCGACPYRERCGGSRARAYAVTGDPLAEDPGCAYQPVAAALPSIAGGSSAPTREQVTHALEGVLDPELGMSVVDLGLVYDIGVVGGAVSILMTLTAPGCPVHDVMPDWIRQVVMAVPGVESVEVRITFDPPWTAERIKLQPS